MSDYRFALRAYPSTYRQDHGAEVVDIANELAGNRWSFRQSRSLLAGGLRARARESTNGSRRSVWASGVRVGLLVWFVMGAATQLAHAVGLSSTPTYDLSPFLIMLPLVPIAVMTISTRWWVAVLITAVRGWALFTYFTDPDAPRVFVAARVLPFVAVVGLAWWLALATDGRRAASPVVAGALMVIATALFGVFGIEGASISFAVVAPAVLVLGGLVVSRVDPRLTTSGTVFAALIVTSILPIALLNDDTGWGYWAPMGISVSVLSVMVVASWSGVRRLVSA